MSQEKPLIQIQNASTRILRSPSHESISTEISLLSLSSLGPFRIPSPIPAAAGGLGCGFSAENRHRLTVPSGGGGGDGSGGAKYNPDYWNDDSDLIKNFGALFKLIGLPKSFSTSDIVNSPSSPNQADYGASNHRSHQNLQHDQVSSPPLPSSGFSNILPYRKSSSELDISQVRSSDAIFRTHFGPTSRSCSTWVAVGDVSSTSQLPSPQGRPSHLAPNGGSFTPADLILSVNKKIRQLYIRKRLLVAYRALERLSQSDFDLEKLTVIVPISSLGGCIPGRKSNEISIPIPKTELESPKPPSGSTTASNKDGGGNGTAGSGGGGGTSSGSGTKKSPKDIPLTLRDVERERGRPLSKFERNMMIFNWLHTLESDGYEGPVVE